MMILESQVQALELKAKIYANAKKTTLYFERALRNNSAITMLADLKFNKTGYDPIEGMPLNFIEQLNQMFSDLVVLYAVEELLFKYPEKRFVVNFGARAGFDIQSIDEMVVAECFAVTTVGSNNKLRKDAKKLMELPGDVEKYIYFYSQNDSDEKLEKKYKSFPEITFKRVEKL